MIMMACGQCGVLPAVAAGTKYMNKEIDKWYTYVRLLAENSM